jgi:outer membrane protein OmpA-like peptidoglycan-associated protein
VRDAATPDAVPERDSTPVEMMPAAQVTEPDDLPRHSPKAVKAPPRSQRGKKQSWLWWLLAILLIVGAGVLAVIYREELPAPLDTLLGDIEEFSSGSLLSGFGNEARQPPVSQPETAASTEKPGAYAAELPVRSDLADPEFSSSLAEPQNSDARSPDIATVEEAALTEADPEDPLQAPATSAQQSTVETDADLSAGLSPAEQIAASGSMQAVSDSDSATDVSEQAATIEQPVVSVYRIEFDFDSTALSTDSKFQLDRVAEIMSSRGNSTAVITGYADQRGQSEYNLQLSGWRAQSVASYLVDEGVARDRLQVEGRGVYTSEGSELSDAAAGGESQRFVEIVLSTPVPD